MGFLRRSLWIGLGLIGTLYLGACASDGEGSKDFSSLTEQMMVRGTSYVGELYVTEPDMLALTIAGLENLNTLDPRIHATLRSSGKIRLSAANFSASEEIPNQDASADEWGELAAKLIIKAHDDSPSLKDKPAEDIYTAFFSGVISKLDRYSRYHSAADTRDIRARREGFGGIGISIDIQDSKIKILNVRPNSPAGRAGIKEGDVIISIDGKSTTGMELRDVVNYLRGPIDTKVEIFVGRDGILPRRFELKRVYLIPDTVTYRREGDAAYFRIIGFNRNTSENLMQLILQAQNEIGRKNIKGYILDLRGNPGGLVDQSVATANLFLEEGQIVSTHGRHPDSKQSFEATDNDITRKKPLILIVDGNSASAAEIVAAALQDNGRAIIIGSNTYGKGTVQAIERMPNGGELDITWARYHAPTGYSLHDLGVLPNICTTGKKSVDKILQDLKKGAIAPVPIQRRNSVMPNDQKELRALRQICPARLTEDPNDLYLALKLLQDPRLIPMAIKLAQPISPAS